MSTSASELRRIMLFNGYIDVTDYLKNSPINRWIYKDLLTLLPAEGIEVPVVKIFREIYYQLVSIPLDKHPGADIGKRYLDESSVWLSSASAAQLVFCTVEAMLKRKEELTFAEEIFLEQLQPLIAGSKFKSVGKGLMDYMESVGIFTPGVIEPMPINVFYIPDKYRIPRREEYSFLDSIKLALGFNVRKTEEQANPWMVITDNFSLEQTEWFIKLYKSAMEQDSLLDYMEQSCNELDHKRHNYTFVKIRTNIKYAKYDPYAYRPAGYFTALKTVESKPVDSVRAGKPDDSFAPGNLDDLMLSVSEMIEIVKERFSKSGADEFYGMISNLAVKHGCMNEDMWQMIDGIVPAVIERDKPRQTVRIPQAGQVNINPLRVINRTAGAD